MREFVNFCKFWSHTPSGGRSFEADTTFRLFIVKEPEKFSSLGGRPHKGVLLSGPPFVLPLLPDRSRSKISSSFSWVCLYILVEGQERRCLLERWLGKLASPSFSPVDQSLTIRLFSSLPFSSPFLASHSDLEFFSWDREQICWSRRSTGSRAVRHGKRESTFHHLYRRVGFDRWKSK